MNTSTSNAVKLSNREFYQQRADAALPGALFDIPGEIQKGHCVFFVKQGPHPARGG